jgi:hypothetical protein
MNTPPPCPSGDPAIPEGIDILPKMNELVIVRRWFSWRIVPLIFFAIAWDSFLIFWYASAFTGKNVPWLAIVFPIGHVAVGVGLTYFVVASLVNKTGLTLSPDHVRVQTAPLPWPHNQTLRPGDIRSVWVQSAGRNNGQPRFAVHFRNSKNRSKKLLSGLNEEQAAFIEHHLNATLGLPPAG